MQSDEIESWTLERNTWQLVRSLYTCVVAALERCDRWLISLRISERLSESRQPPSPSREGSTSKNPYSSPFTVVQKLVSAQTDLVELSIIRDWLHSIPSSLNPAEIRRGYLPYTKNKLKQTRRTGAQPVKGALKELDPDAVFRETVDGAGGRLEVQDEVCCTVATSCTATDDDFGRLTNEPWFDLFTNTFERENWISRSTCVASQISHGELHRYPAGRCTEILHCRRGEMGWKWRWTG